MPLSTWHARSALEKFAFSAAMRRSRTICEGALQNAAVKFYLGDVRSYDSVLQAMHGVDFVFHAAALKQVPSCEFFPIEALQTNTLGAENVMKAALASNVGKSHRAEYGQGGISSECDGDVQGADGEMHGGQGADVRRTAPRCSAVRGMGT